MSECPEGGQHQRSSHWHTDADGKKTVVVACDKCGMEW